MSSVIMTENGAYKKPSGLTTTGAVLAGAAASGVLTQSYQSFAQPNILKNMQSASQSIDKGLLYKGIEDAFNSQKVLKDKGVKIIDLAQEAEGAVKNLESYKAIKNALPKFLRETAVGDFYAKSLHSLFKSGSNAAYLFKTKSILVNVEKLGAAVFHEIGHSINHNGSKFWKAMQCLRAPSVVLSSLFTLTALLKRKKLDGEEPQSKFDKATTFVKNNVGKLVTLSFVPIVAEELKATQRGNRLAKQFLSPDAFAKVKKLNRLGAISYIGAALITAGTAVLASKVRDSIATPKKLIDKD